MTKFLVRTALFATVALPLAAPQAAPSVSLAGPLAAFTNSVLFTPRSLLDMVGGSLTSTSSDALLSFDPSFVFAADLLRLVAASNLTLSGSLLQLTDTLFDATSGNRAFIAVVDGSSLVTTGTNEPLLSFDTSQVSASRNFFVGLDRLDILVNNAIAMTPKPFASLSAGDFEQTYRSSAAAAARACGTTS